MELTSFQQVEQLVKEKQKILLHTHAKMDGDALGSIVATYLFLKKLGKEVTAVCSDPVPDVLKFLPFQDILKTEFNGVRDFIITLDCRNAAVDKLKYAVEDNKVNIIITPFKGNFEEKDLAFRRGMVKYDLIMVLDTPDLNQLGSIYTNNTDLFYDIPVINIDHHSSNSRYGHVHLIDPTASSTCEMLFELFQYLQKDEQLIDKDIATLILAGIITDTGSFQNPNTTPKSLEVAADLIDLGANQQEIIRHVYKTKNLTTLKLWGKVLSQLQVDNDHRLVWSTISVKDLKETEANIQEASNIIDELMTNAPGAEIVMLFREEEDCVSCSMRTTDPNVSASKVASLFGGGGHRQAAGFKLRGEKDFMQTVMKVIDRLREYQKERLDGTSGRMIEIVAENEGNKEKFEALKEGTVALGDTQNLRHLHKKPGENGKVHPPLPKASTPEPHRPLGMPEKHPPQQHHPRKSVDVIQKLSERDKKEEGQG